MGGVPGNPAPRSHFLMRIVKPPGCHHTDGPLASGVFTEDKQIPWSVDPLRSTSPSSDANIICVIDVT